MLTVLWLQEQRDCPVQKAWARVHLYLGKAELFTRCQCPCEGPQVELWLSTSIATLRQILFTVLARVASNTGMCHREICGTYRWAE